ncbi:hypothetical protein ACJZ2D_004547 [Fusarium nematophilum]
MSRQRSRFLEADNDARNATKLGLSVAAALCARLIVAGAEPPQFNDLQQEVSTTICPYDERNQAFPEHEQTFDPCETATHGGLMNVLDTKSSCFVDNQIYEGFHMRELYFLATSLLIAKLACPTIAAEDPSIVSISKAALLHLHHVLPDLPCLLWAITILGIAFTSAEDTAVIVAHLEAMRHFAGERAISSVLRLLYSAWGPGVSISATNTDGFDRSPWLSQQARESPEETFRTERSLGLDVLFEESLLEQVIL